MAGVAFPTDAPVVTWVDEGGYDAHRESCWFSDAVLPSKPGVGSDIPKRYGKRGTKGLEPGLAGRAEAHGFDLEATRARVDQFVIHYDVCLASSQCFKVLHDIRGLSVHFLLDVDGTVYQTLDLSERARHATIANDRSIGVEIANMGAYSDPAELDKWYAAEADGLVALQLPQNLRALVRDPAVRVLPSKRGLSSGPINGHTVHQRDFTDAQYDSLSKLVKTLTAALPAIRPTVPRDAQGRVIDRVLTPDEFAAYSGLLGHWHVQQNKVDPGPAFDWDRVLAPSLAAASVPRP